MNNNKIIAWIVGGVLVLIIVVLYWKAELTIPVPPQYKPGAGVTYALKLAEQTQRLSLVLIIAGWISVVIGSLLAVVGAVLGSKTSEKDDRSIKTTLISHRGLLFTAMAIVLGGVGWQWIDRSMAATSTASIATTALLEVRSDRVADDADFMVYKACIEAKCAWLENRMNQDRLQAIVNTMKTETDNKNNQKQQNEGAVNHSGTDPNKAD